MAHAILTAIGVDRAGLVDEVSRYIFDRGGNIEDSRMVNLRGQFALILLIEADDAALLSIRQSLPAFADTIGLRLTLADSTTAAGPLPGIPFKLKTYSMDQPGIIHRVSDLLREFGVNIEDLAARQESAPFAGTPLFLMEMRLTIPPKVSISTLRSKLTSLCDSLNCDVDFEPA